MDLFKCGEEQKRLFSKQDFFEKRSFGFHPGWNLFRCGQNEITIRVTASYSNFSMLAMLFFQCELYSLFNHQLYVLAQNEIWLHSLTTSRRNITIRNDKDFKLNKKGFGTHRNNKNLIKMK